MREKRRKQTVAAGAGAETDFVTEGALQKSTPAEREAGGESDKEKNKVLAFRAFSGLLYAVLSFLFGRTSLLLDTYPLGIALLCASDRYIIYILCASILSAFSVRSADVIYSPYIYALSYILAVIIRVLARALIDTPPGFKFSYLMKGRKGDTGAVRVQRKKQFSGLWQYCFSENIYLRMATACIAAFSVSIFNMKVGGYRYYDLFSAMFSMVAAPSFVFLFSGYFCCDESSEGKILHRTAVLGLIFSLIFSLSEFYVLGISISAFVAFAIVLYFARKHGILTACITGLVCGCAVSTIYAPAFVLSAIAYGLLFSGSHVFAVFCACSVGMLWGLYIDGINAFSSLFPAFLSSSVLVCALESLSLIPKKDLFGFGTREEASEKEEDKAKQLVGKTADERMKKLSETFGDLSSALYTLSDRMSRPGIVTLREMCVGACHSVCRGCAFFDACQRSGRASDIASELSSVLFERGRINEENLPLHIRKDCAHLPRIIIETNTRFAELLKKNISGVKAELFALDYDALSHILSDAIEEDRREYEIDRELTAKLSAYAGRGGMGIRSIVAYGKRKKRIYARGIGGRVARMGHEDLKGELERVCGFNLTPLKFELNAGRISFYTESARRFKIESAKAVLSADENGFETDKENSFVSGDAVSMFENDNDCFYSLISDGMGSGEEAALSSGICEMFLRKMLCGGNKKETALKMLNTLLRTKNVECSATIDLMEADLIKGQACFLKSGAAPSFVRRGDKMFKLSSSTLPIGIIRAIDTEQLRFDLEEGDVIIMLSDGISQNPSECVWLMELLNESFSGDAIYERAKEIAKRARKEGSGDDLSVAIMRVVAA